MEISSSPWNDGGYSPYERNRATLSPLMSPSENEERIESPQSLGDHCFEPLPYMTNYLSVFALFDKEIFGDKGDVSARNEYLLKKYYSLKKPFLLRHNSHVLKNSDTPLQRNDILQTNFMVDRFLNRTARSVNFNIFKIISDIQNKKARGIKVNAGQDQGIDTFQNVNFPSVPSTMPYFQYYRKLLTVNTKEWDILKLHSLWIPNIRNNFKDFALYADRYPSENTDDDGDDIIVKKNLFFERASGQRVLDGKGYVAKGYEISSGSMIIPCLFSEDKLPALTYHCSVELNGNVYIFGGLMPCYSYEEDAPMLNDFFVDGIKNLPPPLLPQVINNPSMVNNPHLYVASVPSCCFSKPKMRGYIPPPLLCVQGSKLTERHIFFYGGFEIRTETRGDENGKYHLKKRLYVNNTGYILDIVSFKFTKIDVIVQPSKYNVYPTMSSRFGHVQISIDNPHRRNSVHSPSMNENHKSGGVSMRRGSSIPSMRLEKPAELSSVSQNNSTSSCAHMIIIFGGYRQTGDDRYEAMNDLWKIEIPVVRRGKKGYCKFAETANAILLTPREKDKSDWPEERAFAAFSLHGTSLMDRSSLDKKLLDNLKKHFVLKPSYISRERVVSSKAVFPMMVHSTHQDLFNSNTTLDEPSPVDSAASSASTDNNIGPDFNYDFENFTTNPRILSSIPMTKIGRQGLILSHDKPICKTIILHGGSNGLNVLDDMWLMDLESETWTPIETFARVDSSKDGDEKLDSVNVGLVGHKMESIGRICLCIGGMIQEDVNELYSESNDKLPRKSSNNKLPLGCNFLNTIDLSTQCWEEHKIILSKREEEDKDERDTENDDINSSIVVGLGGTTLQSDKSIIIIGGLMSRRTNLKKIYLHGTILKSIFPSVNPGT
ncbi:gpb2p [Saccharomyces arboricola H-6]|uniref:Gpb2p n=1 Tax=Saccharomyces arboricola (strain H-6 / AS 2.3317 / CBS 10644) TaxID=1160507 RepID=J8Q567_SACAR|nr:gpb2p [Saccharomyces arboricola H-6]